MGRRATITVTTTKGELDPDLSERVDLEHYYDSLAAAPNTIFHPQGGYSDRGGLAMISDADVLAAGTARRLRRGLVPVQLTAGMITAANGGTPANLVDQSSATLFTTNAVTIGPFVALEIDLGTATTVDLVDLIGLQAELAAADDAISVQYWNGSAWTTFADATDTQPAKDIRTTARTRRFGTSPGGPAGTRISARQWRVLVVNGAGTIGQVSMTGLRLWAETAAVSPIDVIEVAKSDTESYAAVLTERNIDIFDGGRYVASVPVPVAGQQIDEIEYGGGYDTLLLFHEQIETPRIVRQGSAGEWDVGVVPYASVPSLNEQIIFSGTQDEIQTLTFAGLEAGDVLWLALGDLVAGPIAYANAGALPASVAAALGSLPGVVAAGLACTVTGTDAAPVLTVRFTGSNGGRAWPLLSLMTAAAGASATTTIAQPGLDHDGALISAETGWPGAGTFAQNRLIIGGFRAAPTSGLLCQPGSWSLQTSSDPMTADLAILFTLRTKHVEKITSIFLGRHLQIFTVSGEWFISNQTYDATQPLGVTRTTGHGSRKAVPVVFADGSSVFVQQGGKTLRDMIWDDAQQSYGAEPLTVLAPQILSDVIDVAHRSARSVTDGNLLVMVNADGTAGCLTLLRGQNVIAGSPWACAGGGAFRAAMCDVRHRVWIVAERAGAQWLLQWSPDMPLDFSTTVTGSGLTSITGAAHLEGRTDVWAIADGEVLGPFTVTAGTFALGLAADSVTYGLLPTWRARYQPLRSKITAEQPFRPPARIYEVDLAVKRTGHLTLGTNGNAHREVPLVRLGDAFEDGGALQTEDGGAPGLALFDRLYTGNVRVGGLLGFSRHPYIELGRDVPSPVHVKSARIEFVMKSD